MVRSYDISCRQRMGRVILDEKDRSALRRMDLVGKVGNLGLKCVPVADLQKLSEAFSIDLKYVRNCNKMQIFFRGQGEGEGAGHDIRGS